MRTSFGPEGPSGQAFVLKHVVSTETRMYQGREPIEGDLKKSSTLLALAITLFDLRLSSRSAKHITVCRDIQALAMVAEQVNHSREKYHRENVVRCTYSLERCGRPWKTPPGREARELFATSLFELSKASSGAERAKSMRKAAGDVKSMRKAAGVKYTVYHSEHDACTTRPNAMADAARALAPAY